MSLEGRWLAITQLCEHVSRYPATRDRNAIYGYLSAVFDLVMWWKAEDRAISRARWALRLQGADLPTTDELFAMVIFCTAGHDKVDKRTRSKWSRTMRYAAEYKTNAEPLAAFVRRKGGINKCAERFTHGSGEVDDLAKRDSSDPAGRRQSPC